MEANNREKVGHLETDLMEGMKKTGGVVSVTVDRKSGMVMLDKLVAGLPKLISAIVAKLPLIVGALAEAAPQIAIGIIAQAPAIALALVRALGAAIVGLVVGIGKSLAKALGEGVTNAIKSAFGAVKRFFRDLIREIGTLGQADTETFGDTPGAVVAGARGMVARFAPRDLVIADQTAAGALQQAMDLFRQAPSSGGPPTTRAPTQQGFGSVTVPVSIDGVVVAGAVVDAARTGRLQASTAPSGEDGEPTSGSTEATSPSTLPDHGPSRQLPDPAGPEPHPGAADLVDLARIWPSRRSSGASRHKPGRPPALHGRYTGNRY